MLKEREVDSLSLRPAVFAAVPRRKLSARGRRLATQPFPKLLSNRSVKTFRLDEPALDLFPIATWNRLAARRLGRRALELLGHGEPLGYPPLRAAIADFIANTRGVRCTAKQVVVTSGTQESLDLVARLLLDPGTRVWMEDPGYAAVTALLRAHDLGVIGVPVDAQGIDCDAGRERALARFAYVTPACQFPLGVPMSPERRRKLLQWADEAGAWIFEDDSDGLLQFGGHSADALCSLDRAGSVIYSNSFNRLLFSSLRLGFMILPPALIKTATAVLSITRRYPPVLDQATLGEFIVQGHLKLHLQRMRAVYAARRKALIEAGNAELGGLMHFGDSQAGLRVIGWLGSGISESEVWRRAAAQRIDSVALSRLALEREMPPGLVLGFGAADERALRTAIKRLRRVLRGVLLSSGHLRTGGDLAPRPLL
jgi:GntR family transcriptional regulator / MocR family aminotransferase